jgi:glycosyltransferase involved in cell wall biosynthesis
LRLLYVASDQDVPGRTGGSVHVLEVARGLARRGHEVHAVVRRRPGLPDEEERDGVSWHRVEWWPRSRFFRFRASRAVARVAHAAAPQVVLERYYNFGGEGVCVAARRGVPCVLEVNAPVVDHAGSLKAALDASLLLRPMRRYRERLCRQAAALIAPLPEIVPAFARAKTHRVSWGANVEAFRPGDRLAARRSLGLPGDATIAVFSGSFRPWHGVHVLEQAARRLAARADIFFVLAGGPRAREAEGFRGRYLGAVDYERMPVVLAAADIGLAPYDTSRLEQLRLGFFWSPLKVFEYMASGLPTVTVALPPLAEVAREGREALFFRERDAADLAGVIERLADAPELRRQLGSRARERVVGCFSWARHCEQLEGVLRSLVA